MFDSFTVKTATGSNSGLSVLNTLTRVRIEPSIPWLKDEPANHKPHAQSQPHDTETAK